jgi:type VI secretion system protein VasG
VWPDLLKAFGSPLLGRMTVIPYYPLTPEELGRIVRLQLSRVAERVTANYRATFDYDAAVVDAVASRCTEPEIGARAVDNLLTGSLLPELAAACLGRLAEGRAFSCVRAGVNREGRFSFELT